jgi:hypothetical protein
LRRAAPLAPLRASHVVKGQGKDHRMQFNVTGSTLQTVSIDLQAGETIFSQRNVMAWMTDNLQMNTTTGGGMFAAIKRSLSAAAGCSRPSSAHSPRRRDVHH